MGSWHELEDFTSDAKFRELLDHIVNEGGDELIINGDWIDFPQLEPLESYPKEKLFSTDGHRLGWTETDSLQKLDNCMAENAHKGFFDDLSAFLRTGKQVTIVLGNHDPDLFWVKVNQTLRSRLSPPKAEQLQFSQTFILRGTAHIEHGNQYATPENKFTNPSSLFHVCAQDNQMRLEMVWGTVFMMEFFNDLERDYPFADNIKTHLRAAFLGIKNRWLGGTVLGKAIKMLWSAGIPWSSLPELLKPRPKPDELIQNLNDQDLAQEILDIYDSDQQFRQSFDNEINNNTSPEEWRSILSVSASRDVTLEELTPQLEGKAETLGIFRKDPEIRAARDFIDKTPGVNQVIFGHTHTSIDGNEKDAIVPNYFNTGCWVSSMDLKDKEKRKRLKDLKLEDLRDETLFEIQLHSALVEVAENNETSVQLLRL